MLNFDLRLRRVYLATLERRIRCNLTVIDAGIVDGMYVVIRTLLCLGASVRSSQFEQTVLRFLIFAQ